MFEPKYQVTNGLLENIKRIVSITTELNLRSYPEVVLVRYEARARQISSHTSTSIEGNVLPLTEVKRILKSAPENLRESEREVVNYNDTLLWLDEKLKKGSVDISLDLIKDIQFRVMKGILPEGKIGQFRREPVQLMDPRSGGIVYLPPDAKDIEPLLDNMIDFVRVAKKEVDPAIIAGLTHKQFVIIHPFIDGNGRTARLLSKILLANMGIDTFKLFSFENYYNKNVTKYFLKVGVFGDYYEKREFIDFTEWLTYFTEGIVDELLRVKGELEKETVSPDSILPEQLQKMVTYIEKNGFINDAIYAGLTKRSKASRTIDFKKLTDKGLIKRVGKGKNTFYRF